VCGSTSREDNDQKNRRELCGFFFIARAKAGIDVRMIGRLEVKWSGGIKNEHHPGKRLHVRAIIRDGRRAFMGSQRKKDEKVERREEKLARLATTDHG
jgi:hypothetical protein